jgi:hypothetical protein
LVLVVVVVVVVVGGLVPPGGRAVVQRGGPVARVGAANDGPLREEKGPGVSAVDLGCAAST